MFSLRKTKIKSLKVAGMNIGIYLQNHPNDSVDDLRGAMSFYTKLGGGADDWAILELDEPIGVSIGYFEIADTKQISSQGEISGLYVMGYTDGGGRTKSKPTLVSGCKIPKNSDDYVFKTLECIQFAAVGMSGGAMIKNVGTQDKPRWMIFGVASTIKIDGSFENTFVNSNTFKNKF